jgi:membrane-associated phospholipid phosphatase
MDRRGQLAAALLTATVALGAAAPRARAQSDAVPQAAARTADERTARPALHTGREPTPSGLLLPRHEVGGALYGPSPGVNLLEWRESWGTFDAWDWTVSAVSLGALITSGVLGPRGDHWVATNGFDEGSRRTLRVRSLTGGQVTRDASDVLLALGVSYPVLVDSLLMAAWFHDSPGTGVQMLLLHGETLLVAAGLLGMAKQAASRVRPYVRRCGAGIDPELNDCHGSNQYRSFFSGHTSQTFAAAGVTCMFHAYMPIHGGGASDRAACATGLVLASATGLFRIMGDQHYMSDVLAGAAVGLSVGLFVPWFMHFRHGSDSEDELEDELGESDDGVQITVAPYGLGLALVGQMP